MINPKDKGNRGEREWAEKLVKAGLDKYARRMPRSGAIPGLRADIHTNLPIQFEVKNCESWSPRKYYDQAKIGINIGSGKIPVVVLKANNTPYFIFMDGDHFITLLSYALRAGWPNKLLGAINNVPETQEYIEKIKEDTPDYNFYPVPKPEKRQKKSRY